MKETFHVYDPGDRNVGIFSLNATITVEDNNEPEPETIKEWKEALADIYDIPGGPGPYILTEKEYQYMLEMDEKAIKEVAEKE